MRQDRERPFLRLITRSLLGGVIFAISMVPSPARATGTSPSLLSRNDSYLEHWARREQALKQTVSELRESVSRRPHNARPHFDLGKAFYDFERYELAAPHFRTVIRLQPYEAAGYYYLGKSLFAQGRTEEALLALGVAARLWPRSASEFGELGSSMLEKGQFEGAVAAFREWVRVDPYNAKAHELLAKALYSTGRYQEAWHEVLRIRMLGGKIKSNFVNELREELRAAE